jgi:hypothetical protein
MNIFGPRMGTWYVSSQSDPRWNNSGRASGLVTEDGPQAMKDWIEQCRRNFGEPPEDAVKGFMKD